MRVTRRHFLLGAAALGVGSAWAEGPASAGAAASAPLAVPIPGVRGRAAWRALSAKPGGRAHVATRFALHHTAGALVGSDRAPATLRGIQAFHQRDKGWVDLAYHLFVDADGVAWEGRDPALAGDTATAYDPAGYFLVCALGNFEDVQPPAAQVEGVARLLAAVHATRAIPLDTLTLHRDVAAETVCPGNHLATLAPAILVRARAIVG